jgi:hypothetical protein
MQGDVLKGCPVFLVIHPSAWPFPAETSLAVKALTFDLVLMTQSCDLEHAKVEEVLLAQLIEWPALVRSELERGNELVRGSRFRRLLLDGGLPGLSLLHKRGGTPGLQWSVVDFHRLFTLPKAFVQQFAASAGPRLRLRSPYREYLAQAFARYFMRVGLPLDAKAFEKEGDIQV